MNGTISISFHRILAFFRRVLNLIFHHRLKSLTDRTVNISFPPYKGMDPYIFVSYSHEDTNQILPIITTLYNRGYRVWFDKGGISGGFMWAEITENRLIDCTVCLPFLTDDFIKSKYCQREIHLAVEEDKEIFPVYLKDDIHLKHGLRFLLAGLQYLRMSQFNGTEAFVDQLDQELSLAICRNEASMIPETTEWQETECKTGEEAARREAERKAREEAARREAERKAREEVERRAREQEIALNTGYIRFLPYEGEEPYIFVNYSHRDSARILPILEALFEQKYRVWFDKGILRTSEWPAMIEERLCHCAVCLMFISDNSVKSRYCSKEIFYALHEHKPILPVYLEDVHPKHVIELELSCYQSVQLSRFSKSMEFVEWLNQEPAFIPCRDEVARRRHSP